MNMNKAKWEKEMGYCNKGQKVLHVQRYAYPPDWIGIGPVENQYKFFKQVLEKRDKQFQDSKATLAKDIQQEESKINQ